MVSGAGLIRNGKLLTAINKGAKIVNLNWLLDSKKKGEFVEITDKYLNFDETFEKKYKCSLKKLY
jgi:hypothetical protein